MPRYVWTARPLRMIWRATWRAASIGTANPMPMLPLVGLFVPVRIWFVIPTTWPNRLISGPPELPWLMAASVWIAL